MMSVLIALCAVQDIQLDPPLLQPQLHGDKLLGPDLADLDGDGKPDLVAGVYAGQILYFRNTGTAAAPSFEAPKELRTGDQAIKLSHW